MKYNQVLSVLLFVAAVCISPGQSFAQSIDKSVGILPPQAIEERMAANLQPNRGESALTLPYFESAKDSVVPASPMLLATSVDISVADPTIDQWSFRRTPPFNGEHYSQNLHLVPFRLSEAVKPTPLIKRGIQWNDTLLQSLTFTAIMNAFRIATEPSTRKDLKGPFWKDYFNSVKSVRGWKDGDEFLVNYIGHPLEGAVSGNILVQNDQSANKLPFGRSKQYWMSRLKAFGWAAALSTQFELGPFGEASIGNVGLTPSEKSRHPAAYVDLVVTPVAGTGWLIGEDILDRFLIKKIESRTTNRFIRLMLRSWLTPGKSFANMMRGQWWWHRDDRPLKEGGRDLQQ
jgi:hypothetical protein